MFEWLKKFFANKSGIYKCDACNGTGMIKSMCSKCQGTGKLDWVEKVVGKLAPANPTTLFSVGPTTGLSFNGPAPSRYRLLSLKWIIKSYSIKDFFLYLYGFDIFIETKRLSIPFLKSIVTANMLVWIILFLAR